jgi:hypothetical protein
MTGNKDIIKIKEKIISKNLLKYFWYINYRYLFNIFFIELISVFTFIIDFSELIGKIMLDSPSNFALGNLCFG